MAQSKPNSKSRAKKKKEETEEGAQSASEALTFIPANGAADIEKLYHYNTDVLAETADRVWSLESLKSEVGSGWELYAATIGNEIVAPLFLKTEGETLFTKNMSVKLPYQGKGFSHQIKEFFESYARAAKLKKIVNYCRSDNFRTISLNETHGYKMTKEKNSLMEWVKILK